MRVIVIGGGIVGTSTAYHLARGGAQVALVDRGDPGQATAAGAGIVWPWAAQRDDREWHQIAVPAAEYYPTLAAELAAAGLDPGYTRVGGLSVGTDVERVAELTRRLADRHGDVEAAGAVRLLNRGQAREMFPVLSGELAAAYDPAAARVDGRQLRDALRAAAARLRVVQRAGDARPIVAGDRVVGVEVNQERMAADAVVVAAGAWSSALLQPHGVELALAPQRGQIVHVQLPGVATEAWPVVETDGGSHYLLAFGESRVVFGATRETGSGFDYRVTAGGLAEILDEALTVAPGLASASHLETRVGFRPLSGDGLPLLGPIPELPGLVVATGLGSYGLTVGPYAGSLAAAVVLGKQPPDVDLKPYSPTRVPEDPASQPDDAAS